MKTKVILLNGVYLAFLAVITAAADSFFQGGCDITSILILKTLVYLSLYTGFFILTEKTLMQMEKPTNQKFWHRFFWSSWKDIIQLSVFFFAVYYLYLHVFYPGTCGYDTVNQITDLITGVDPMPFNWGKGQTEISVLMNDHHPVATTWIFTQFYKIGLLTGDANRGMYIYNLLQIIALSVLFASVVCRMDKLEVPKPVALISTVFYASPVIAFYAITMIKDSMFSLLFVLYYLVYAGFVINRRAREIQPTGKQWVLLILLSILLSLTNKKGMYITSFSNFCLAFVLRGNKKVPAVLSALVPCFVIIVLMGKILFPLMNIYPGGKQEALGFTFQQTALTMIEHPETYTEEEKEIFFSIINLSPDQLEERYDSAKIDAIKDKYRSDTDNKQLAIYLKMWAAHFLKTPKTYLRALLSVCGGYIAPVKDFDIYTDVPYSDIIQAFQQPEAKSLARENLVQMFAWLLSVPILKILSQDSLYLFWFPAFSMFHFINTNQRRELLILIPLAANFLFLLVGPVCWTRYGLCQLYTYPVLLAFTTRMRT